MADALKGKVPLFDTRYNLRKPVNTGKAFVSMSIGAAMLVGAMAVGRMIFNRASEQTSAVNKMEAF